MDTRRGIRQLWQFSKLVARRFHEDRCLELASSLAFTTVLARVPLITVVLTLVSALPGSGSFGEHINRFVAEQMLPEVIGRVIIGYIEQFIANAAQLTALGIVFLVAAAASLMYTIERTFNSIWRVPARRRSGRRTLIYVALLAIGPTLIGASLWITSYVVSISLGFTAAVPGVGSIILWLVPLLLTVAAFALLYFVVPATAVRPGDALVGGAFAGALFELMKRGFAFYLSQVPTFTLVYGAFATVPLFLLWIYMSWVVIALGAVVTALMPRMGASGGTGRIG
jgi:membrane protein